MIKRRTTEKPLWYKDAIIYELHVKSFCDSNDDGIGDFQGLISKLDYLEELGITAIWLLPFYPSPLKDDGYDIADYKSVNPDYGTLRDFKQFLREAHKRNIRVITELVINHTSDQHKWFQRARKSKPGSVYRDFYVWSDSPEKYSEARIIFKDFEHSNWSWDPEANAYYWHRFYSHQPDLNFDSPSVKKELFRILDFWLGMGVDGLRLDAIPYLVEREGTNCENLAETHAFLKELRDHVEQKFPDCMLLAEANQWPEDAADYFGEGDECHMAFHFPVMPRLFMALQMEDRFPIVDMIEQSMDIPENCQWAMFLRNHDELTLEMVTDEERDYMYRAYAQDPKTRINLGIRRRLAPLLDNNRRKIELLNFLLMSLPGTPVLYYGDEIGMGDNYYLGDRDGVRTPMQWSSDRNAGFSRANSQRLFLPTVIDSQYHYAAVNVENQTASLSSILWFMRRLISLRNRYKAFGRGEIEFVHSDNARVLSFIRRSEDEVIFVIANLSRFCQVSNINMPDYAGQIPEEVFSGNQFPQITTQPYVITLGPHNCYWFLLKPGQKAPEDASEPRTRLKINSTWNDILNGSSREAIESLLAGYIKNCRWFGGKNKPVRRMRIIDSQPVGSKSNLTHMVLLSVSYKASPREIYLIPLAFAGHEKSRTVLAESDNCVLAELQLKEGDGIVYEAVYDEDFRAELFELFCKRNRSGKNRINGIRGRSFKMIMGDKKKPEISRVLKAEQSNTSIIYDNSFFLKLFRRLDSGQNPDAELTRYLTEQTSFSHFPAFAGLLQLRSSKSDFIEIGLLSEFVFNESDSWVFAQNSFEHYLGTAASQKLKLEDLSSQPKSSSDVNIETLPDDIRDLIGPFFVDMIILLGKRTGQLHQALNSLDRSEDTRPEPFSMLYQKSVYQSMRAQAMKVFEDLSASLKKLPEETADSASQVISAKSEIMSQYRSITRKKISAMKIRIHGDYHLGQVLYTGKDFVIIDFEGEPLKPISERRLKRSALRDVAGMLRSLHYAAHACINLRPMDHYAGLGNLQRWADLWYCYTAGLFMDSYLQTVEGAMFVPSNKEDFQTLMEAFLLEKAVYELGYELHNRPQWLNIPVNGIKRICSIT